MSKKAKKPDSISTFLGNDSNIEGTIEFKGTIRVDGKIKGKIISNGGTAIVGEQAQIEAEFDVGIAIVMGEVNGTVKASDRIEIYPPGRINGDIEAPMISIEEGGTFNGNCLMTGQSRARKTVSGTTTEPSNTTSD